MFKQYSGNPATMKVELCVHASAREYFFIRATLCNKARYEQRPRVCLSTTSLCSIKTSGCVELVLGMEACFLQPILLCARPYKETRVPLKDRKFWNSGLENFATLRRLSQCVIDLAQRRW